MIRASINVTKVKWDRQLVAQSLANDPKAQAIVLAKAHSVAADAATRVAAMPKRKPASKARWGGKYPSERPDAVANLIQVKAAAPLLVFSTKRGTEVPVALIVADHPYSDLYKSGIAAALLAGAGGGWAARGGGSTGGAVTFRGRP